MTTREKIKRKIDKLPEDLIEKLSIYINSLESKKPKKQKIRFFSLKGKFDDINIRQKAYE